MNTADTPLQMRRVEADVGVQGSGGVGTQTLKLRESSLGKKTLGAFLIGTSCTPDTWLADTGANMHIVNDVKWFKKNSFRSFHNCSMDISTADGSTTLGIEGGGTVQILLKNPNGSLSKVSLSDVAYAPQGKCNLFSGGIFAQKARLTGVYNDRYMTWVDKHGYNVGYAVFENGLYHLDIETTFNPFRSGEVVAATVNFDDPVWKWHRRLGHLGFQNMLKLLDSSTGMDITPEQIRAKLKAVCPVCAVTRALVKIPRDPAKRHAREPGQMVHVDSWGPYPIEGFDGTKYFLFVTDDCTRYTWCARFDHKHELFEIFKTLLKFIQKTYNIVVRCCRLDNEFENGPIGRWCDAHAIAREPIEPYAHYQNGVAERTNRTIRERAAPMIQEKSISGQISKIISEKSTELLRVSKIPENLWPEAVQHAVWLKNRTPARALRKKEAKTPYEALKGEKPTLSRERIWGSRTYVTYPPEFRDRADMTKLHSPRGWLGYFVGCESEAIYKIYSPDKHRVYRIGVARIEDGEGLEDLHDEPCLEDRVPRVQAEVPEQSAFPSNVVAAGSPDGDQNDALAYTGDDVSEISSDDTGSDTEPASDDDTSSPGVVSRYFAQPRHAGMAKRKMEDGATLGPKSHREATHTFDDLANDQSSSEESDPTSDSWYYTDGKISQEYLDFVAKHGQRTTRTYLPDNRKCDSCFRFNLRCGCTSEGVRCSTCALKKRKCVPQTEETKRLILPENRDKPRPIAYPKLERPCRLCFQTDRSCHLAPGDIQCERCKSKNRKCRWDLDGARNSNARQKQKDAKELATQEKLGFKRVPRDRKCYRCAQRNIACDGRYPCVKCNTLLMRRSCRPQGMEQLAACNCCLKTRDKGRNCDRGRPCRTCMEQTRNCTYDAQNGLLKRTYQVQDGPLPQGFSSTGPLIEGEPSDEECTRCQRRKTSCDGEHPCYSCVKQTPRVAGCHYRKSDGTYESWEVRPFHIVGSDGNVRQELKEDYQNYVGQAKLKVSDDLQVLRRMLSDKSAKGAKGIPNGEISHDELDDQEDDATHEGSRKRIKKFKFGLSAYNEQALPPAKLNLSGPRDAKYYMAKTEELRSHDEKGTWKVVPLPVGVKPVTSRWVNTDKYGSDGQLIKLKSRLVARGFQQEEGIDYEETFASVVKSTSTRILLALAAILSWNIHQGDVKTAFLNSDLDKPVYMKPPKDIRLPHGFCLMVIRALYGLKQLECGSRLILYTRVTE